MTRCALDADLAALRLHQLPGDHQPQPRAALIARPCAVHAPEAIEDMRQIAGSDPGAGVAHLHYNRVLSSWSRIR
jgi:hypothetical protein